MLTKLKSLKNHQGFMKYFKNTSWLFGEKILRMIVGLFVGIWVARYLGPEQFGLFSYAQSFVGLFTVFATLGLDVIVVRELVKDENKSEALIATAFWLKLLGGLCVLIILGIAVNFTTNDHLTNMLIFIIASATIFQSFNVVDMYFQSKVMSEYIVYSNVVSLLLSSIVKIIFILTEAPLIAFAWIVLFDSFVMASGYVYFYIKKSGVSLPSIRFHRTLALRLLKDSWMIIIAGAAISVYMKIDQVMIKEILNSAEVGQYAVAVKLSESWYFISVIITASLFPAIVKAKQKSEEVYYKRLQHLYNLMVIMSIMISIVMTFMSEWIVELLYGQQYAEAGGVLMIHIWAGVFVFLSVANDKWFYIENKTQILAIKVVLGACANICLNILLIPIYGIKGAAIATIMSYSISVFWSDLLFQDMKRLFIMKFKAIILFDFVSSLSHKDINEM